ncbi:hypothetical protein lerEdw1_005792 [Lerista edwardsae]|nr:hypothetical protein lerEdw1_005792 [Lerista edwardsae]
MAEGEAEGSSPLHRSVSFQRPESWTGPEGGGGPRGEQRQEGAQPCQAQPPSSSHRASSSSASRNVAKLAAASPGPEPPPPPPPGSRSLRSLSPSVRRLSQRFCAPRGSDDEPGEAARGRATGGGKTEPDVEPAREQQPPPPLRAKGLSEPPKGGEAALDWPSVTEMRKLFGESFRRQEPPPPGSRGDPQEDGLALRSPSGKGREPASGAPGTSPHLQGTDGSAAPPFLLLPPEGAAQGRREEARPVHEERRETPPPPPPRSCIPFPGLRGHRLPRASAERPPPPPLWDSLHSWHSSPSKPPAAPSSPSSSSSSAACGFPRGEVFSSSEEELPQPPVPCLGSAASQHAAASSPSPSPFSTGGIHWHKSPPGSSGSEEEEENHLVTPRKRACRKKKKAPQEPGADAGSLAGMEWHRKAQEDLCQHFLLPAEDRARPPPEARAWLADRTAAHMPAGTTAGQRAFVRGLSEGSACLPGSHGTPPLASPLSLVSRVSKVNIPPFVPSPCGSRSSSRYSSTETLKEEDQSGPSWAAQGRGFQGGPGLFRSPSFGQSLPGCSLARLQPQVRTRPKLPLGMVKKTQDLSSSASLQHCGPEATEKSKHRKSMSNPDIATETLTLLNFLKSDLSELRARKKGARASDPEEAAFGSCSSNNRYESYYPSTAGLPTVSRTQSEVHPPSRWALGGRPSLKDLTATLRRAKSFTYSDKAAPRRLFHQSAMKQSSSELLLATARHHDGSVSDSEVGRRGEEDGLPIVIQDQYIQEARQVFEKISRMGSQQDCSFALERKDSGSRKGEGEAEEPPEQEEAPGGGCGQCLRKTNSEGDLSGGRSLEELSGPESTMTDEGIVTEPEAGLAYSYLNPSVAAWKSANQRGSETSQTETKEVLVPSYATKASNEQATVADEILSSTKAVPQGLLEAPSTPGAVRRRRKFPSVGNSGSESSNGSNGESNGDAYRSLSDPMPHRKCSISEDSQNFSVDSNLLGSLNSKSGLPESSAVALSECTGSAASDLSVCSDGVKDYNTVIQNIVSQPGAMDRVIDEKGNGKTIKKKSFSDPSRRGELASAGFDGPGEPINEMDQSIPPSSSEPILSEQAREREQEVGQLYSQSEHVLPAPPEGDMAEAAQNYGFDPKLAEVLSPRIVRRSSKKRSNRASCQENRKEDATPAATAPATLSRTRPATKHVRHTSEPATFIPISEASLPTAPNRSVHVATPDPSRLSMKPYPVVQAPSLEDVTKHYMLTLGTGEPSPPSTVDTSRSSSATPTTSEPRLPRCPKHHEEHSASSARSKPQVWSPAEASFVMNGACSGEGLQDLKQKHAEEGPPYLCPAEVLLYILKFSVFSQPVRLACCKEIFLLV